MKQYLYAVTAINARGEPTGFLQVVHHDGTELEKHITNLGYTEVRVRKLYEV